MLKPETMTPLLANLDEDQQRAVTHDAGALLIIAGPGSGKTRVITHRAAYQIAEKGIPPDRILCVTFTNKAAREMQSRLARLVPDNGRRPDVSTFHAFGNRLLRSNQAAGIVDPNFTILDQEDQLVMVKQAMALVGISTPKNTAGEALGRISAAKNRMQNTDDIAKLPAGNDDQLTPKQMADIFARYDQLIHGQNCLDFDDLLLYAKRLLESNDRVKQRVQRRYRSIMVDEFQDTNVLQYRLTRLLTAAGRNLCAVGDPDQCIYAWRNAEPENLERFKQDFAPATVLTLGRNYRSTGNIVRASANVISHNPNRESIRLYTRNRDGQGITQKALHSPREEAVWVMQNIEELTAQGYERNEIAVAYRTNHQSLALETQATRHNIPYVVIGGTRFWARREIKDITAYLEIIRNPDNQVAYQRALTTPPKNIGVRTVERIRQFAAEYGCNIAQAINSVAHSYHNGGTLPFRTTRKIAGAVADFAAVQADLQAKSRAMPPSELIAYILQTTGLERHIRAYDQPEDRWDNVDELIHAARQYDEATPPEGIAQLLAGAALTTAADQEDKENAVTLISLHQAKGLEWQAVFIVGLNEGLLPLDRSESPEEERRLCYVGMTRAKERLYLSYTDASRFGHESEPSRFLDEYKQPAGGRIDAEPGPTCG